MLIDARRYQTLVMNDDNIKVFIFPITFINNLIKDCNKKNPFTPRPPKYLKFTFDNMVGGAGNFIGSSCELLPLPMANINNPNILSVNLLMSKYRNLYENCPMGYVPNGICAILCSDSDGECYVHFAFFTFSALATSADKASRVVTYDKISIAGGGGGGGAESTRIPAP